MDGLRDLSPAPISPQWSDTVDDAESRIRRRSGSRLLRGAVAVAIVLALGAAVRVAFRPSTTSVSGLTDELVGPPTTVVSSGAEVDATAGGLAAGRVARRNGAVVVDPGRLDPELAGYRLLAARESEFIDIDLATGEATTHRTTGTLIGAFGRRLIMLDPATGVTVLPVADAGVDPDPVFTLGSDESSIVSAVVDETGVLQITTTDPSAQTPLSTMIRIDLASRSEVRAEVTAVAAMGLVEISGGGLFSLDEDGFRRLTDGSVELYGSSYLLVERCDDPQQCSRSWLERSTGVLITRPTPAFRSGYVLGRRGRVAVGTESDRTMFFDVRFARDVTIDDAFNGADGPSFVVEDLTDDDRFLAAVVGAAGNDIVIHDLDTQTDVRFELGRSSPFSRVLFVPKADQP